MSIRNHSSSIDLLPASGRGAQMLEVTLKIAFRSGGCGIAFVEACQEMTGFEAASIAFENASTLRRK